MGASDIDYHEVTGFIDYLNIGNIDNWNFVSRLGKLGDSNNFVGSVNGYILELKDDSQFDAIFPYKDSSWYQAGDVQ